jgi:hypothetical protein
MTFQPDKFRELVLYIARKSEDDPKFGAVKLNKILFFSDFAAFRALGRPITGARYQALTQGPAPRELLPIKDQMESAAEIVEVERSYFGYSQRRIVARREPRLDQFTASEIALVDDVLKRLQPLDGRDVSLLSHEFCGWEVARANEDIPYETALLTFERPTQRDLAMASHLNEIHGWTAEAAM